MIALLVATLAAFALWYVELRPSSSSTSGGSSQGVGQYQGPINQAHQAVATSGAANARLGAPTSTAPAHASTVPAHAAAKPARTAKAATTAKPATAAKPKAATKPATKASSASTMSTVGVATVQAALKANKVVAILFYNGSAADDQAVKQELSSLSTDGGKVVKLAVPLSQLTNFALVTQQVPVVTAPTFVVIDAAKHATSITGFADTLQIQQLVAGALTVKP